MSKNKGWVCDIWTLTKYSFYHGIGLDYQLISSSWCNLKIWGNNFTMQINIGLNKNAPFALKMFNANKSKHKKKKKSNLVISNLIKTLAEVVAAESSSSSWSSSCTQPIVTINPSKLSLAHAIATLSWLFFFKLCTTTWWFGSFRNQSPWVGKIWKHDFKLLHAAIIILKVQLFWEGHKNVRNCLYGFEIYLVNIKTIRMIAHIFVAFLEKLNFEGRIEKFEIWLSGTFLKVK